jgi:hypothetical protein
MGVFFAFMSDNMQNVNKKTKEAHLNRGGLLNS